jgi:DNA invertase Pin-like site-specific DNA recombinase
MNMSIAAHLRVSTGQQSVDQQRDALTAAGIAPDRVFTDTASRRAEPEVKADDESWPLPWECTQQ